MTLCPIALAVGCKKCPAFGICPLKTVIGDYKPEPEPPAKAAPPKSTSAKSATSKATAGRKRRSGKRSR